MLNFSRHLNLENLRSEKKKGGSCTITIIYSFFGKLNRLQAAKKAAAGHAPHQLGLEGACRCLGNPTMEQKMETGDCCQYQEQRVTGLFGSHKVWNDMTNLPHCMLDCIRRGRILGVKSYGSGSFQPLEAQLEAGILPKDLRLVVQTLKMGKVGRRVRVHRIEVAGRHDHRCPKIDANIANFTNKQLMGDCVFKHSDASWKLFEGFQPRIKKRLAGSLRRRGGLWLDNNATSFSEKHPLAGQVVQKHALSMQLPPKATKTNLRKTLNLRSREGPVQDKLQNERGLKTMPKFF
ncbi:Hypothetical predicted protein [Cloeon dipterum]|uniref:Uncharacterized protein n=1 Tax=Cloeon dipterum TaxID=197152 RepID=A0A8S1DKA0_9INSE|nr:Hypothetical predicted protein [Cloeon dipterum]